MSSRSSKWREAVLAAEHIEELSRQVEAMHAAMEYRAEIEQAKGVIMRTTRCNAHAAFALLVVQSQTENRKIHEIATEIAAAQEA
jgi:AmiR/NasT family two-component response regulator